MENTTMIVNNEARSYLDHVFCDNCVAFQSAYLEKTIETKLICGFPFEYEQLHCFCPECGTECFPLDMIDENKHLYDEACRQFREKHGIVSQAVINEIPQKYGIGIRPLSLALGWGELTYTRFFRGECPSREYSDLLLEIYRDPRKYRELLCKNNDRITKIALKKSLSTVNKIIDDVDCGSTDLLLVALIKKIFPETSSLALQKLLYFIQGFYGAFTGTNCMQAKCFAWARGPVYAPIYFLSKEDNIEEKIETAMQALNRDGGQRQLLPEPLERISEVVIKSFGVYSGDVLTSFTHSQTPWITTRNGDDNTEIPFETIQKYFEGECHKYNITSTLEISKYAAAMFANLLG